MVEARNRAHVEGYRYAAIVTIFSRTFNQGSISFRMLYFLISWKHVGFVLLVDKLLGEWSRCDNSSIGDSLGNTLIGDDL